MRANIAREPMLHTWRGFTKSLEPLLTPHQVMTTPASRAVELARRSQLLPTLAALHPRLAATPPQLLIEANRVHAHGLLRQWARSCWSGCLPCTRATARSPGTP